MFTLAYEESFFYRFYLSEKRLNLHFIGYYFYRILLSFTLNCIFHA